MSKQKYDWESSEYRSKREELLQAEEKLIEQIEEVASLRRQLPPAGQLKQDYVFQEGPKELNENTPADFFDTKLSDLFENKQTLIMIHFMYPGHGTPGPCSMCTLWADSYNAVARYVCQRAGFALTAKTPLQNLRSLAQKRNWNDLRLLSSHDNSFNQDFCVEREGKQFPGVSVFSRKADGSIEHFYSNESIQKGERGIDLLSPLWHLLDITPEGRGDWYPGPP